MECKRPNDEKAFGVLEPGDVFIHGGTVYVKTDTTTMPSNAISSSGRHVHFTVTNVVMHYPKAYLQL